MHSFVKFACFCVAVFIILDGGSNCQVDALPSGTPTNSIDASDVDVVPTPQMHKFELNGRQNFEDSEEDEDEDATTVKGPGHEGILKGLSGIFSNIVKGDANGVVESTFNFVPPVYQKNVNSAYNTIVGRTTTTARPSSTPLAPKVPQNSGSKVVNSQKETAVEEDEEETTRKKIVAGSGTRTRPERPSTTTIQRPRPISNGDDEEDERAAVEVRRTPSKYQVHKEVIDNSENPDDDSEYQPFQFQ